MNILHVSPYYPPAWAFGPTPADVAALAREQVAQGHHVTVLTTDALAPHERAHPGDTSIDGVRVVRVRNVSGATRTWLGCSTPIGMRRAARSLAAKPVDVLHLHELVTMENLRVAPAVPGEVPIVASLHGQLLGGLVPRPLLRAWRMAGGSAVCARVRAVVADTPEEAAHARGVGSWLCARPVEPLVITRGLDMGQPADGTAGRHHGEAPVVIVDGRTNESEALRAVVRAFAAVRADLGSPSLVVSGPESAVINAARETARLLGLDAHVQWAGYLPPSRMRPLLDRAAVLVLPEGSVPTEGVVVDALARGVVVLTAGAPLSLESAAVLHVADATWTGALRRALEDTGQLRAAAIASVAPHGWPAVAERWLRLYGQLGQGVSGTAPGR